MRILDLPAALSSLFGRPEVPPPPAPTVTTLLESLAIPAAPTPASSAAMMDAPTLAGPHADATVADDSETAGRFVLGKELGRGAMGRVGLADDPELLTYAP